MKKIYFATYQHIFKGLQSDAYKITNMYRLPTKTDTKSPHMQISKTDPFLINFEDVFFNFIDPNYTISKICSGKNLKFS